MNRNEWRVAGLELMLRMVQGYLATYDSPDANARADSLAYLSMLEVAADVLGHTGEVNQAMLDEWSNRMRRAATSSLRPNEIEGVVQ